MLLVERGVHNNFEWLPFILRVNFLGRNLSDRPLYEIQNFLIHVVLISREFQFTIDVIVVRRHHFTEAHGRRLEVRSELGDGGGLIGLVKTLNVFLTTSKSIIAVTFIEFDANH